MRCEFFNKGFCTSIFTWYASKTNNCDGFFIYIYSNSRPGLTGSPQLQPFEESDMAESSERGVLNILGDLNDLDGAKGW